MHQRLEEGESPVDLMHANDAAAVTFRENGRDQKYLFVTKCESKKDCSIVKLAVDDDAREYRFVAEYSVRESVSGISLMSGGGTQPAVFLLNGTDQYLPISWQFSISTNYPQLYSAINTPQGIHYEPANGSLYLPFFANPDRDTYQGSFTSVIRRYDNVSTATGTISEDVIYEFTQSPYFEIEGVGFRLGESDRRLWFNTYDDYVNGGIYIDTSIIK